MAIKSLHNWLRIIILFLMDKFFKISFGSSHLTNNDFVNSLIFCSLSSLFVLPIQMVYFYLLSVYIVLISNSANKETMKVVYGKYDNLETNPFYKNIAWEIYEFLIHFTELQIENFLYLFFRNLILQLFLLLLFNLLQSCTTNQPIHKAFSIGFFIPSSTMAFLPSTWVHILLVPVTELTLLLQFFVILKTLWMDLLTITKLIRDKYSRLRVTINRFRINNLFVNVVDVLEMEWDRLDISCVLRMFWALRVIEQILYLLTDEEMQDETFFGVVKNVFIKGSDTFTAVLGMTSILSYFCAALLHHIHFVGIPLLMSLSVSYNSSRLKHITALLMCGFLIVFPITMLTYFWYHHSVSTWLLAVSSFSIHIVIKLLESLAVYSLFLRDTRRKPFWKKLDDYVYYIKLFGITVELFFVIFFFLYGVYITAFVSDGAVHTSMMFIHVYFNIWCDARDGWRLFIKSRTAVKKFESLPTVQLPNFKVACAICGRRMKLVKTTKCNHYFHGKCLRKWLYFKDRCQLCHDILFKAKT